MTEIEKKRLLRCLIGAAIISIAIGTALFLLSFFNEIILCPFRAITGFSCPGCGNTRAFVALIHGHFAESLTYNYAYPVEYLYLLWVIVSAAKNYVKKGKLSYYPNKPIIDTVLLVLVIVWWIVRNILGV